MRHIPQLLAIGHRGLRDRRHPHTIAAGRRPLEPPRTVKLTWGRALLKALKEDADDAPELQADYAREPSAHT